MNFIVRAEDTIVIERDITCPTCAGTGAVRQWFLVSQEAIVLGAEFEGRTAADYYDTCKPCGGSGRLHLIETTFKTLNLNLRQGDTLTIERQVTIS